MTGRRSARRAPITPEQIAEIRGRLTGSLSLRQIAAEMDLDPQTVMSRARSMIAEMKAAGTLGKCVCGKDRFHPYVCLMTRARAAPRNWETEEHRKKRAGIIAAIMRGETYAVIAGRFGLKTKAVARAYLRHLTPEQRRRRKDLERRRCRATAPAFRPFRDETYSKISAAMPRTLSDASRDDAISDMYLAMLEGRVSTADIAAEARRFASRAVAAFESKFGPRSLDERLFDGGDLTFGETLVDPAALDAFDYIFEEAR